jgi:hypothetical protein
LFNSKVVDLEDMDFDFDFEGMDFAIDYNLDYLALCCTAVHIGCLVDGCKLVENFNFSS